jgi:phosphoserine phosphatase RsbU/P
MKLRRLLLLLGSVFSFVIVFVLDVIRKNVELDIGGLNLIRDLLIILAFALVYIYLEAKQFHETLPPAKRLGLVMIYAVFMLLLSILVWGTTDDNFDTKDRVLIPLTFGQVFISSVLGILFGLFSILVFRLIRGLVLFKRRKGTERNFLIYAILALVTAASTLVESAPLTVTLFGFAIVFGVVNSFRLPWIVYLSKREKVFALVYGFLLFGVFIGINAVLNIEPSIIRKSLVYYSAPLHRFVLLMSIFGNIYFGMSFVSTLFHLPTAEAFDRKSTEVTSLHNLSRLVTQVFDFNELVETVLSMTLQVCEAKSCWLEILQTNPHDLRDGKNLRASALDIETIHLAGKKNIEQEEIDALLSSGEKTLRDEVLTLRKPIVVDDLARDSRFKKLKKERIPSGSLVVVPLTSHAGMVGILYATKGIPFGFFKDDIDVISAFADQATIAIENSRLIKKSIERERLLREMTVAQEIQRKLLPQFLPQYHTMEIDASSTPAFEVGGDYYDVVELEGNKLGIAVGDVSGKGVSAAFYMSEVKGIFQSLSRLYPSPRDFMIKANEALSGSIDKHSFVSLIYAVVDRATGTLVLARAGHCPLLYLSGATAEYVRPGGMGLGLATGEAFSASIEEHTLQLVPGDVCVFYTDGVTEARSGDEEFGYERLRDAVIESREKSAAELRTGLFHTVKTYTDKDENDDDLTLMVLKWLGNSNG